MNRAAEFYPLAIVLLSVLFLNPLYGTTYYWDAGGGADTTWNNAANWDPDGVPTSSDDAYIDPYDYVTSGSWTITVTANASCNRLYVRAEEDYNYNSCDINFTINSGDTLTLNSYAQFETDDPSCDMTVHINGTLDANDNDVNFENRESGTNFNVYVPSGGYIINAYTIELYADRDDVTMTGGGILDAEEFDVSNGGSGNDATFTASGGTVYASFVYLDKYCNITMTGGTFILGKRRDGSYYFDPSLTDHDYGSGQGGNFDVYNFEIYLPLDGGGHEIDLNNVTVRNNWDVYEGASGSYNYTYLDVHDAGYFDANPFTYSIGSKWEFHGGTYPDFWNSGGYVTHYGSGYYSLILNHGINKTTSETYRVYFEYLNTSGMQVLDDYNRGESSYDYNELSYSTFRYGQSDGQYITYNFNLIDTDSDDTLWWSCVDFENDGPTYNIYRSSSYSGNIGCNGGSGDLWGESYDYDPGNTVQWKGGGIPPSEAPTGFSGTAVNCSTATWTWTDNSSNEEGFRIYDDSDVLQGTVDSNVTSWTEYDLHAEQTYTRYVVAYVTPSCGGSGESNPSNTDNVTPNQCILGYISVWDGNLSKVDSLRIIAARDAPAGVVVKVVNKDDKIGAADLVDTTNSKASPVRIYTNAGTKSWRKK